MRLIPPYRWSGSLFTIFKKKKGLSPFSLIGYFIRERVAATMDTETLSLDDLTQTLKRGDVLWPSNVFSDVFP
jgi:hypothetical protein